LPNVTIAKFEDRAFFSSSHHREKSPYKFLRRSGSVPEQLDTFGELDRNRLNRTRAPSRSEVFSLAIRADKEIKTGLELERQTFEAAKIPKL
jgi:hypothetical protein